MFHKKALKNTVTCFVLLTLVFSTLIVAALAASASSSSISVTVTATKIITGDRGSATASYISRSHTHDGFDSYSHSNSYVGVSIWAYGEGEVSIDGGWVSDYGVSSISNSITTPFGWNMTSIGADAGYGCGYCEYEDEVSCDDEP